MNDNQEKRKILIAREIKQNFKILLISIFISLVSIPIISWKQIEVYQLKKKYDQVRTDSDSPEYKKVISEIEHRYNTMVATSLGCVTIQQVEPYELNGSIFTGKEVWDYDCLFDKEGKVFQEDKNLKYLYVFLISFLTLAICRYLIFATKWVNYYSKKDI